MPHCASQLGILLHAPLGGIHLTQKLPQCHEEGHQVTRVARKDPLSVAATHVFGGSAHCRRNDFARRVHQQLCQPFKHLLDDLWVWLLKVGDTKTDTDVCDAACNLDIRLGLLAVRMSKK